MYNNQFEDRLKEHAETLFGQGKEPPAGHRARFEQRLREMDVANNRAFDSTTQTGRAEVTHKSGKTVLWKAWLITTVAAAAVLIGVVCLLHPFSAEQQSPTIADVRNYYSVLLEEQAESTRQLIQQVDETNRKVLFDEVDLVENDPLPDIQIPDDEYIVLIASFYTYKIEELQNIQNIIKITELQIN
jgi:hypothetical protein